MIGSKGVIGMPAAKGGQPAGGMESPPGERFVAAHHHLRWPKF